MPRTAANASTATLSQTPFDINVRKDIEWDFSGVEPLFVKGNPLISYLWAGFSAAAPPIERFFVKQLKPTIDTIKGDPKLMQDVQDMIAQEVQHSAAHMKLNKHLESVGYDMKAATQFFEQMLEQQTRGATPIDMLGIVAAGEHALYSIAQVFVADAQIRKTLDPKVERLFLYHFLEEAEHGAVSHDQYRYFVGGNYFHRLSSAYRARTVFSLITGVAGIFAKGFGFKPTLRDRLEFWRYLWIYPGLLRKVGLRMLAYLAPWYKLTFEHQDIETLQAWNKELYASGPQ